MASATKPMPEEDRETLAADVAGMGGFFIDPAGAARCLSHRWFWLGPVILVSCVSIFVQWQMIPVVRHVLETGPVPANASPEQVQSGIAMGLRVQQVTLYVTPLIVLGMLAIQAAIVMGMSSLLSVQAKFRQTLNLVAGCSLISALGGIATLIVVKAKGEVSSMAALRPPLGLDIFLPETTNKFVLAFVGYFSVFQIWLIVMFVLTFAAAFRTKKSAAFTAYLPVIVLTLLFSLIGAAFQRS
jgi:hypothetical protein